MDIAESSLFLDVSKSGNPISYPYVVEIESVTGYIRLVTDSEL